jgi:lysophospholipase L1-like esterase
MDIADALVNRPGAELARPLGKLLGAHAYPGCYNFRADNLARWRRVLARSIAGFGRAKLVCVGDSTTSGQGAGFQQSYPAHLARRLAALGLKARASARYGYFPSLMTDVDITAPAGWGASFPFIGGNAASTNGTTLSWTPGGSYTKLRIIYNGSSSAFTVSVNGETVLTTSFQSGTLQERVVTVPATSSPVVVTGGSGGGGTFIASMEAYGEDDITVVNGGWSGSRLDQWVRSLNYYERIATLKMLAPDLAIIKLGANDANHAQGDISTFAGDLQALIDACRISGDVVLMTPNPNAYGDPAKLAAIREAYRTKADDNDLPLIDLFERYGSYEAAQAMGYMADTVHKTGFGYADEAQVLARMLAMV